MIAINLLPKNLKKTEQKINLPYRSYIILAGLLLFLLHISLFSFAVVKKIQWFVLKKGFSQTTPQSREATVARKEIEHLESQVEVFKKIFLRKVSMTEFLSALTVAVPKGLWLERFSFSDDGLVIQGSVISLSQNEMTIIGKFLQDFKSNAILSALFSKIDLKSVQRRTIKTYDVVDYVLVGEIKK
jgi:hypothetical protein